MSQLILKQLSKRYGHETILDAISLTVEQGDVLAILGSSGSGKSTLLRCINQLVIPDAGSIQFADLHLPFPVKNLAQQQQQITKLRRRVGMVFQQFNLWPHMTVLENLITAPIHVLKKTRQAVVPQAEQYLEKVGLASKMHSYPAQLSGGQQQRIAIARALIMQPELMLFDEPTSALDPEMSREVMGLMRQLVKEGMTALIATHEIQFAREVASHVLFLEQGHIVEYGHANQVLTQPKSPRLKAFLEQA